MLTFTINFQHICSGTYYEEWLKEPTRVPLPHCMTFLCMILGIILHIPIQNSKSIMFSTYTMKNDNSKKPFLGTSVIPLHFESRILSWTLFGMAILWVVATIKVNR